jgi:hypothetical protein
MHLERHFTPCGHDPFVGGALFRFVPFLVNSSLQFSSVSVDPIAFPTCTCTGNALE